jgi:hypothetical protein
LSEKSIMANCPMCKKILILDVEQELFTHSKDYPIPFIIEHCDKPLIVYIDADYKVRGIQPVFNILERKNIEVERNHIKAKAITPDFISTIKSEEKIILTCEYDCDSLKTTIMPNVLEKQIIRNIAKYKEISIAILLDKLSNLEKALNRKIDQETILKITEKYIKKGIIKQQFVKFQKDFTNVNNVELSKEEIEDSNF